MAEDTTNNYSLTFCLATVKFIKPVPCVDANHETVVAFHFLEKIDLDISQKIDPFPKKGCIPCSCSVKFDKGKTVMFKLTDKVFRGEKNAEIPLNMEVYQKLEHSCLPTKLTVGKATTDLRPLIEQAFNSTNSKDDCMPYKKTTYEIKDEESNINALLEMTLIMEKLDQVIINDFSISEEGKFFMKGEEKKQMELCKTSGLDLDKNLNLLSEIANMPVDSCGIGGKGHECCPCAQKLPKEIMEKLIKDADGKTVTSESESFFNSNEYICEEISAVMNGNAVKIRIPRKKGLVAAALEGKTPPVVATAGTDKPERTMVFGENEVIMTMRQKGESDELSSETFNTAFTAGDPYSGKPTVNITPTSVPNNVQALKVIETDKDVFLLKINKKCHAKEKATLELELATPKPPLKPVKPMTEIRGSQYDPNDCPPPTPPPEPEPEPEPEPPPPPPPKKKGKGGKGKKGKGGKGKGKKK